MKKIALITLMFMTMTTVMAATDATEQAINNLCMNAQETVRLQEQIRTQEQAKNGQSSAMEVPNSNIQLNVDGTQYGVTIKDGEVTIKEGLIKNPNIEIDTTSGDIERVNKLLSSYNDDQKLSFTEKLSMWQLMLKYNLSDDMKVYVEDQVSAQMVLW